MSKWEILLMFTHLDRDLIALSEGTAVFHGAGGDVAFPQCQCRCLHQRNGFRGASPKSEERAGLPGKFCTI